MGAWIYVTLYMECSIHFLNLLLDFYPFSVAFQVVHSVSWGIGMRRDSGKARQSRTTRKKWVHVHVLDTLDHSHTHIHTLTDVWMGGRTIGMPKTLGFVHTNSFKIKTETPPWLSFAIISKKRRRRHRHRRCSFICCCCSCCCRRHVSQKVKLNTNSNSNNNGNSNSNQKNTTPSHTNLHTYVLNSYIHTYLHTSRHTYIHMYRYTCLCLSVWTYVCMSVCVSTRKYVQKQNWKQLQETICERRTNAPKKKRKNNNNLNIIKMQAGFAGLRHVSQAARPPVTTISTYRQTDIQTYTVARWTDGRTGQTD